MLSSLNTCYNSSVPSAVWSRGSSAHWDPTLTGPTNPRKRLTTFATAIQLHELICQMFPISCSHQNLLPLDTFRSIIVICLHDYAHVGLFMLVLGYRSSTSLIRRCSRKSEEGPLFTLRIFAMLYLEMMLPCVVVTVPRRAHKHLGATTTIVRPSST